MAMARGLVPLLFVLSVSLLGAEPTEKPRKLTVDQEKEVARLAQQVDRHLSARRFEDAVAVANQIANYRAKRQGAKHWQVIDARLRAERWQRLTKVPQRDRAEVMRATVAESQGGQLSRSGQHKHAEVKLRECLAIRRRVLGEGHPETVQAYHNVAWCLDAAGKHEEALAQYRRALADFVKALGEEHPDTASGYNNMATCLYRQGKHAESLPIYRKALNARYKALGAQHPVTAQSYSNLALSLYHLGKHAEALPNFQKSLAIRINVLGEDHLSTASVYGNVASCYEELGRHVDAFPLHRKALQIRRKIRGEEHRDTALSYSTAAFCLHRQGRHADARALYQKSLDIRRKVDGEEHPSTATSYSGVAICLNSQGQYGAALHLYQKSLRIRRKEHGEEHADTATSYNNVAQCLDDQGRHKEALPKFRKALATRRKLFGEEHLDTAQSYNNLGACLDRQGKHDEALRPLRHALDIHIKLHGETHPDTATCYHNVANCLYRQGKHAEALALHQKALATWNETLGELHPTTSIGYESTASSLFRLGRHAAAVRSWQKALRGYEIGRLLAATSGFDRALYRPSDVAPQATLAAALVGIKTPHNAWEHAESGFARGLLDDALPVADAREDTKKLARVQAIHRALSPLLARDKLTEVQTRQRDALVNERDELLNELALGAARRSRDLVVPLKRVQQQIATDAALVFWLDVSSLEQRLGCVLRRDGPPVWVRLPGTGNGNGWTEADKTLPSRALALLSDAAGGTEVRRKTLHDLRRQRLAPLQPHLKGIKRLYVVPAGKMAEVPVEALSDRYMVSYVPSASVFARSMEQRRPLDASALLVLADPVFTRTSPKLSPAPPHGVLVTAVTPGGLAARIGLRSGDVLLEHNGAKLAAPGDWKEVPGKDRVPIKVWRDGNVLSARIPTGKLSLVLDKRPVAEALVAWRDQERNLLTLTRGDKEWPPLPGTRLEARILAALVPKTTTLLGSDASAQKLTEMAAGGKLKQHRILHFATHGEANSEFPKRTALILAQDRLPISKGEARAVLEGRQQADGRLTVDDVLNGWELDADLVVLSACQSGQGKRTTRSGMLGFTQAFLQKGARSVVLSRWKVDDAATSLLMARFYQNLLGKREGLKQPLKRAEALDDAKRWLRSLSRAEATKRLAKLVDGVPRGERGTIKAALPTRKPDTPKDKDRPFAHPYYWAAFVLIGDPN